eukprot:TRINITY_DN17949_c0_g1_i1.p1 TRINITY_DN17949_c0_g1~~TRINITY_DN17949_c0_g1_i1.p1  ORF type:complete len:569 (+),score=172.53 TRINITY_DN17949_c0_g1_i1:63-1769(+)
MAALARRAGRFASVAEALRDSAELRGGRLAAVDAGSGRRVTHRELLRRSAALGSGLARLGVHQGDRVAVISTNNLEYIEVYAAATLSGFVAVPLNALFTLEQVSRVVAETSPVVYVVEAALVAPLESLLLARTPAGDDYSHKVITIGVAPGVSYAAPRSVGPSGNGVWHFEDVVRWGSDPPAQLAAPRPGTAPDLAGVWAILYTSGTTTGRPKGALRRQEETVAGALTHAGPMGFDERTVGLVAFPLHSVSSFFFAFVYLYLGGSMVITSPPPLGRRTGEFGAHLLDVVSRHGATYVTLAPAHFADALAVPEERRPPCPSLRQVLLTGATSAAQLRSAVSGLFPSARVFDVYGSTEAGLITMLLPEDMERKGATVGKETPGTSLCRIVDPQTGAELPRGEVGAVLVRTPMLFSGYYDRPGLPRPDPETGYFPQGDLGYRDEDGFLVLRGRVDDMITLPTGQKLYPAEAEGALSGIPGVREVLVLALPNPGSAQRLAACVVSDADSGEARAAQARGVAERAARLDPPKRPASCFFLPPAKVPRTANGKIVRPALQAALGGGGVTEVPLT